MGDAGLDEFVSEETLNQGMRFLTATFNLFNGWQQGTQLNQQRNELQQRQEALARQDAELKRRRKHHLMTSAVATMQHQVRMNQRNKSSLWSSHQVAIVVGAIALAGVLAFFKSNAQSS
ncbi:hypothetical protein AeRB84_000212 [Aphanomyces euteiches]|nr:hypothetical protein AeRB84_000212 [Aphanomyces euteiches]